MGNNATIRLAAQICCISDYFLTGRMERNTAEELTAQKCVEAIRILGTKCKDENFAEREHAKNAWSTYTHGKEYIGIKEILDLQDTWNDKTAIIEYQTTKYDFLAVKKLRQLFVFNGGDMYAMETQLNMYRWDIMDSMKYASRIPRSLRNVLTKHLDETEELTWEQIKAEMELLKVKNA